MDASGHRWAAVRVKGEGVYVEDVCHCRTKTLSILVQREVHGVADLSNGRGASKAVMSKSMCR